MTAPERAPARGGFRHFHEQLAELRQRLLAMSEQAEALVALAVEALLERDAEKAALVIDGDRALDRAELEVEGMAIQLLALQQPMARDLRLLVGAIKVSSDLERVGDHAVNIAQGTRRLVAAGARPAPGPELEEMARRARRMLADALDAFTRGDGALGRAVCRADDAVDALYDAVFRTLTAHMTADPRSIPPSLELLLVSRNLERVADLATNIAEDAVYVAEAVQIRHRTELDAADDGRPGAR
ncbi:phosphate signaling complex protein PhoU [Roseisolibacter sp. H3M3-2]|uniref:phosphate signaling complex protein PhoU n=1 Tax=Roseisolibacter sp. H3M3-2 TaxID=3031323 RepID=UPI0023DCB86A|nr:phosphate signaling complex protein PhoU [Roseisolibacter sp. H3M3-2]MDF1503262.1 phosphate signaling complex protein PhoU [Roseisolibacter sp. H3M3-2]